MEGIGADYGECAKYYKTDPISVIAGMCISVKLEYLTIEFVKMRSYNDNGNT